MEQDNDSTPSTNESCIICTSYFADDPTKETVNVTTKGIDNLIKCSKERRDGKEHVFSRREPPFRLHKKCRSNYTNINDIKNYLKRKMKEETSASSAKAVKLRSSVLSSFNPQTDCLFCSKPVSQQPRDKDNSSCVSTLPFITKLKKHIEDRSKHFDGNDNWGSDVQLRISSISDLVADDGQYHRDCCSYFYKNIISPPGKGKHTVGRPKGSCDQAKLHAFNSLCNYIQQEEECQYSLQELKNIMDGYLENQEDGYSLKQTQNKLLERYGNEIVISEKKGQCSIVCFKDFSNKILRERWKAKQIKSTDKKNILELAGSYLSDDIRTMVYNTSVYPEFTDLQQSEDMVPESVLTLLQSCIKSKAKNSPVVKRKICAISHAIISAARPRSFVSPILLAISVYVHKNLESKELVTMLNTLGFADDYREVKRLYAAFMTEDRPTYSLEEFTNFIFDNADYNIRTLTGRNTWHALGGLAAVSPDKKPPPRVIPRSIKVPTTQERGKYGKIDIKQYRKPPMPALTSTVINTLDTYSDPPESLRLATTLQTLWIKSFPTVSSVPSWSGFMNSVIPGDSVQDARIVILPFINLNPSDLTTLYSALCFAKKQCDASGFKFGPVTFDQPLYVKAAEIIAASPELHPVLFAVLGGFHMAMSYLGSIGYIMGGSGLAQLWEEVYAPESVKHMLSGHHYSRALRANYIAAAAAAQHLEDVMGGSDVSIDSIASAAHMVMNPQSNIDVESDPVIPQIITNSKTVLTDKDNDSRTVKLWKQYIQQVVILCLYMYSERSGDLELQKYCICKMIPIFHAAGHLPYAKASRLYLQQLNDLEDKVDPHIYSAFNNGNFTVAGNFTDQTIETRLMRLLKTKGGVIHGRSITDSTLAEFVHALPQCVPICQYIETITGVYSSTSEQHKDLRPSSKVRDDEDVQRFISWFQSHSPCEYNNTDGLVSLTTGEVASSKVNCEQAYSISTAAANAVTGQEFPTIKLKSSDKVVTFNSAKNSVKVRGQTLNINPEMLFHRITCVLNSSAEMEYYLSFELAPYPPALFKEGLLRKNTKSDLTKMLKKNLTPLTDIPANSEIFIDGGYLLRKYIWCDDDTFHQICLQYITYIQNHYSRKATVVFDGYDDPISTKKAEQKRRAAKGTAPDLLFTCDMKPTTSQTNFMHNGKNKSRLISMLKDYCKETDISTCQAGGDADHLIVSKAIAAAAELTGRPVVVVGNDADLVAMLTSAADENTMVYIMLETNPVNIYKVQEMQENFSHNHRELIITMHCLTGCDTTSACFQKAKPTGITALKSLTPDETAQMKTFITPYEDIDQKKEEVAGAGEKFMLKLYKAATATTLNRQRYISYNNKLKSAKASSKFTLETLPPTSAAARQHSFRAYHAVQQSQGNHLNPLEWGWVTDDDGDLIPVYTDTQVAPDRLLKMISCGCKTGCANQQCSCFKLGIHCSVMCSTCNGQICKNIPIQSPETDDNDVV